MIDFGALYEKVKKRSQAEPRHQTTATSAPIKGANQDQSGVGVSHDNADYTISDGFIAGVSAHAGRAPQVMQKSAAMGQTKNSPKSASALQSAASRRTQALDKIDQKNDEQQVQKREQEITKRKSAEQQRKAAAKPQGMSEMSDQKPMGFIQWSELNEKNWIQGAIKKPGALHKQLGVPEDEKIPAGKLAKAAHAGGKLGQRARLAQTLKKINKEEVELDEAKRGRPRKVTSDTETGSEHPVAQLRKIVSLHGQPPAFVHADGKTTSHVDVKTAHSLLAKHDNMKTSAEKLEFSSRIHRSPDSLKNVIAGKPEEKKPKVSLAGKITGTQK